MCVCEDLPAPIVPVLHQFVQRLSEHVRTHRDADLDAHEQGVLDAWRAEAGAVLTAVLTAATTGADRRQRAPRSTCPACGEGCAAARWRDRSLRTRLGPIRANRTLYHCPTCGHRWARADQTWGLQPYQQTSAQLQDWEARVGALTVFREAQQLLADLSGLTIGSETLRTHAHQAGQALETQQQAQVAHVADEHEPLPGTEEPAPGRLVAETDGVHVRYRCPPGCCVGGWHEVKLGIIGGWVGRRPDAVLQSPSYVAARADVGTFTPRVVAEAARRGALDVVRWEQPAGVDPRLAGIAGPAVAQLRPVVVLGDGAKWIWESVAPLLSTERVEIVDWFHSTQHLWELAKVLHGAGTSAAARWEAEAETLLWEEGAEGLLPLVRATTAATAEGAETLERERGYFGRNAARMQYPAFRRQGLPLGSGAVESAAKYLVQQRMKRAGMRWSPDGAHAILQLRCRSLTAAAREAAPHRPHARHAKAA